MFPTFSKQQIDSLNKVSRLSLLAIGNLILQINFLLEEELKSISFE